MSEIKAAVSGAWAIAVGLFTTLKILFRSKTTIPYPEQKKPRSERFRGRHELRHYTNGLQMCVACELCQIACPAKAITIIPAENDPASPQSPGERYAAKWEVNLLRCIFCGMCEEACPTEALRLTKEFELAAISRDKLIYTKEKLLGPRHGEHLMPEGVYPPFNGRPRKEEAV